MSQLYDCSRLNHTCPVSNTAHKWTDLLLLWFPKQLFCMPVLTLVTFGFGLRRHSLEWPVLVGSFFIVRKSRAVWTILYMNIWTRNRYIQHGLRFTNRHWTTALPLRIAFQPRCTTFASHMSPISDLCSCYAVVGTTQARLGTDPWSSFPSTWSG